MYLVECRINCLGCYAGELSSDVMAPQHLRHEPLKIRLLLR